MANDQAQTSSEQPIDVSEKALDALFDALGGRSRKDRQNAAQVIAQIAAQSPEAIAPHADKLVDAMGRPEAQTRWQAIEALTSLVAQYPNQAAKGAETAEEALYDEESGMLRYTAFRYFAKLAGSSKENSREIWPLLEEALQCFHGDPEFAGMLDAIVDLVQSGDVDTDIYARIASSMTFDAQADKSPLARRAKDIIKLCNAKSGEEQ